MSDLEIEGPLLRLRYPRASDAQDLFSLASDPDVTKYFSWGPYERLDQAQKFIAGLPGRREAGELCDFAITHPDHATIGITGLSEIVVRDRRATVGTWLGRSYWGTGANREAKALIFALAFDHLGLERLTAYADIANERSQAALAGVGFTREGQLRHFHRHGDVVHDVAIFSLLAHEWRESGLRTEFPAKVSGQPPAAFKI
ncbi:MAG: GNAT family protein [Solirubrobacterales bacterium]|nr:GNAT family protein [Solirubrobacterales bacterium]